MPSRSRAVISTNYNFVAARDMAAGMNVIAPGGCTARQVTAPQSVEQS